MEKAKHANHDSVLRYHHLFSVCDRVHAVFHSNKPIKMITHIMISYSSVVGA